MKLRYHHIRWLVAVVALLVLPAMAQVRDTIDFNISDFAVENVTADDETFMLLSHPDCDHIDQIGAPMLPVKYIRLSVPYNATDITVTVDSISATSILLKRIYPAQVPQSADSMVSEEYGFALDSVIYASNAFWPPVAAQLVGEGFYMGDNRVVTVAVYPFLYNPAAKKVRKLSQVQFSVNYNSGEAPANMLVRRGGNLRLQEQQSVKTLVANPEKVEQFAMSAAQIQHMPAIGLLPDSLTMQDSINAGYGGELESVWGDRARYLIVTTRSLAPAFKRLAALKRQKGYSVQIKCIEDILADPRVQDGDKFKSIHGGYICINDSAGKLRQYLKLAYTFDNTQFVLLGGKDVPYRCNVTLKRDAAGVVTGRDSLPTDWYYADLTQRWSESYGYDPVYYFFNGTTDGHELLVGRLMAESKEQIENYTDKLIRYELNPGHGDASYLNRCLVVEGSELNPRISTGTIMANAYSQITPDTTLVIQSGHDYPTGGDVISLINTNQYGILSIHGHGNPYATSVNNWNYWYLDSNQDTVHTHKSYQRICSLDNYFLDSNNGLDCLRNKYCPGIYYSWSCDNAPFDNFQRSYYRSYDTNMAQSYVLGKDYGGVAFLGNTRSGFYSAAHNEIDLDNSPKIEKNFAQLLSQGMLRLSEAEATSKELYCNASFNDSRTHLLLTHNLHGDPELKIWPGEPQIMSDISISRNNNTISITGLPQNDSIIVAIMSSQDLRNQKVLENGSATFNNADPNSSIMVYSHNYLPYIAPLYLQNERIERSQYVIANDVYAGRNVDTNRSTGDLTIAAGSEYEIETKGQVVLGPGFMVEKGALFSVTQSDY